MSKANERSMGWGIRITTHSSPGRGVTQFQIKKSRRLIESRGHKVVGEEVTIDVIGTRRRTTRIDLIAEEPNRARYLVEGKNGLGARLNPNQREAFPILSREGGYPRGLRAIDAGYRNRNNKADFNRLEVHRWNGEEVTITYE